MSDINQDVQDPAPKTEAPMGNDPKAREADGTLKDQTPKAEPEKKAEETKDAPKDEKKEEPKKDAPAGAPEKYEAFKVPEGVQLSEKQVADFQAYAKEKGLNQEDAQKLVDMHTNAVKSVVDEAAKVYTETRDAWRGEVLKDPTLAHNGDLKPEVKATMSKAIDALGPDLGPKFREALNLTGVGDNPAFVRGFHQFASKFNEGTHVSGKGPAPTGQSKSGDAKPTAAQAIYPTLPSQG